MKPYQKLILGCLLAIMLLIGAGAALAASTPAVNWSTLGAGGAPSGSGAVTLNGTLGQPVAGPSSGGNVALGAGYWYGFAGEKIYLPVVKR